MHPLSGKTPPRQSGRVIKHHPSKSYRAVTAFAAAAVLSVAASASAQDLNNNIFGGVNTAGTTLSVGGGIAVGAQNTGPIGPGFTGNVNLGVGAGTTLTETLNDPVNYGPGTLTIAETGAVGVVGGFGATKTFTNDAGFSANQYYRFTLTTTNASTLSLLSGVNIQLTTSANGTTTTVVDTSNGTGTTGTVNLLSLLSANNGTASFTFLTPANVNTTSPITFAISGNVTAGALGNAFSFTGASLQAVPEPGTWAALGLGLCGLVAARMRRRVG